MESDTGARKGSPFNWQHLALSAVATLAIDMIVVPNVPHERLLPIGLWIGVLGILALALSMVWALSRR